MSEPVVRRTFAKRLSRTIILLVVPLFVLSLGVFYQYARDLLRREAVQRSNTILSSTERLVENYLSTIENAANSYVWMFEEKFTADSLAVLSHRLVSLNGSVLSCSVATEPDVFPDYGDSFSVYTVHDGDTVITAIEPEFEYFQKNWYKKPMQAGAPCWINPFSDFNEGTINHHDAVGSYCVPLRPHGDRIKGIVSVDFSFQQLRKTVLATHHPYPSSYYMLLGPSGGYLIHPESSLLFKKTIFTANDSVEHPDVMALGRAMVEGKQGMMHVVIDNVHCHVNYMPVSNTGWSLALVCHDDDVLADYNHLAIIMIVFVVIGMVLIAWITRRVVQRNIQPLNELMEATKKVADGNYDTEIPLSTHTDVVGKLQNAFRNMQQALLSRQQQIRQNAAELEADNAEMEHTLLLAQEAAKSRRTFVDNVSREFVTPLNIIGGLVRVLRDNLKNRGGIQTQRADICQIRSSLRHQAVLLQRNIYMLYDSSETGNADVTRYQQRTDEPCNQMAQECADAISYSFDLVQPIRVETEVPDSLCVNTSRLYVTRAIKELLFNAAKFSDGQHITIRVSQIDTAVRFTVEDVGPGLPENSKELFFMPFTKGDDQSEGLGLGLPLCQNHIDGLGGTITHDDSYRDGCRITIELPKA